jgi:outer membrane receptor protein involved in Fe transport
MKNIRFVLFMLPFLSFAQQGDSTKRKLGPNPVIIVDSVKLTHEQFMAFDPTTIARVTVLTDTDATNHYGPDAKDGVVLAETKAFARKH